MIHQHKLFGQKIVCNLMLTFDCKLHFADLQNFIMCLINFINNKKGFYKFWS